MEEETKDKPQEPEVEEPKVESENKSPEEAAALFLDSLESDDTAEVEPTEDDKKATETEEEMSEATTVDETVVPVKAPPKPK